MCNVSEMIAKAEHQYKKACVPNLIFTTGLIIFYCQIPVSVTAFWGFWYLKKSWWKGLCWGQLGHWTSLCRRLSSRSRNGSSQMSTLIMQWCSGGVPLDPSKRPLSSKQDAHDQNLCLGQTKCKEPLHIALYIFLDWLH